MHRFEMSCIECNELHWLGMSWSDQNELPLMQWVVMSARVALRMVMSFIESNELNVMSCIDWENSCTELQ